MTKAIRIHASDNDDLVHSRHEEIEKRLEDLGRERVSIMMVTGGLPTTWHTIVHAWLAGDKLEPKE